jgi:hypothetical protein
VELAPLQRLAPFALGSYILKIALIILDLIILVLSIVLYPCTRTYIRYQLAGKTGSPWGVPLQKYMTWRVYIDPSSHVIECCLDVL